MQLREDQIEALVRLRQAVAEGKKRICMQAPTGFGKTILAASLVKHARDKGKRVLYTVPAVTLVDQTWEMFFHQGVHDVGVIQASHHLIGLGQAHSDRQHSDLAEARHARGRYRDHRSSAIGGSRFMKSGCTSSQVGKRRSLVCRLHHGSVALVPIIDQLIVAMTTGELINKGLLSRFKVYAPTHPDLSDVRIVGGDYHRGRAIHQNVRRWVGGRYRGDVVAPWARSPDPVLCGG